MSVSQLGRRQSHEHIGLQPQTFCPSDTPSAPSPEGLVGFSCAPHFRDVRTPLEALVSPGLDYIESGPLTPQLRSRLDAVVEARALEERRLAALASPHARLFEQIRNVWLQETATGDGKALRDGILHVLGMPVDPASKHVQEKMLRDMGLKTSIKPAILLLVAQIGRIGYGMGPTLLEHAVNPYQPSYPGTVHEGQSGAAPIKSSLPPPWAQNLALGPAITTLGIIFGATVAGLLLNEGKKTNPKGAWRNFLLHLSAIGLVAGHRFLIEWLSYNRPDSSAWLGAIPGIVGASIFGYTVPNSITAAEMSLGMMPLGTIDNRVHIGELMFALSLGLFALWGVMLGQPGLSPYSRESVLISATLLATTGYSFSKTNALQVMAVYARGLRTERLQYEQHQAQAQALSLPPFKGPRRPAALALPPLTTTRPRMPSRGHGLTGSALPMLARTLSEQSQRTAGSARVSGIEMTTQATLRRRSEPEIQTSPLISSPDYTSSKHASPLFVESAEQMGQQP